MVKSEKKPGWLFVVPWGLSSVGGVNTVVKSLVSEINKEGKYRPLVLVADWSCESPLETEFEGYTEIRWRLYPIDFSSLMTFLGFVFKIITIKKTFNKICEDYNVEIYNAHYPTASSFLYLLSEKRRDLKVVYSFHGVDVSNLNNVKGANRWLWNFFLKKVGAVITCSRGLKVRFLEVYPDFDRPVQAIHNGVSSNFNVVDSGMVDSPIKLPPKVILSVGTFEEKKGQETLITAFSNLSHHFPDWNLVFVGRKTSYLGKYQELVKALGVSESVYFYSNVPPEFMPSVYEQADIFVLPSNIEPFGLVILEAAMFDLPVISTKTDGALEIIENNEDGVLVDIGDSEKMEEAIIDLIRDADRAKSLSSNLKSKAINEFSWSKCYQSYIEVLNNLNSGVS